MKKSDRCKEQYCQLCWLLLLLHGTMLLLFHGDQLGQSNFCMARSGHHHILWSTALVAMWRNLVNVAYRNVTQKSLANAFVAMAVADRAASLHALWHFIAMVRDCNYCNWFDCEHFGAFMIIKGCGPVTYCGEGIVVALHSIMALMRLIVAWHVVCSHLPLWQEACCCFPWQMRPPRCTCCTCSQGHTCCLWRTHCTCIWQRAHLWQRT